MKTFTKPIRIFEQAFKSTSYMENILLKTTYLTS